MNIVLYNIKQHGLTGSIWSKTVSSKLHLNQIHNTSPHSDHLKQDILEKETLHERKVN